MNAIRPHRAWITTAALLSLFSLSIHAQAQSDNAIPRTASGQPLLQGYWTSSTVVPFERPQELGDQAFYTEEEAQERLERSLTTRETEVGTQADVHYQLDDYGLSRGQNEIVSSLRTSIVTSPSNGRLPPLREDAQERGRQLQAWRAEHGFDSAQDRPLAERCIIWPHEGPPLLPVGYNSNVQIMQTKDHLVLMSEMIHDARVIPLDGVKPDSTTIPQWQGSSWGHWEGDTLVIQTTGFSGRVNPQGAPAPMATDAVVTERLTRLDDNTIQYQFTVSDPTLWTSDWSGEYLMMATEGPIFEYACHEGNYGLPNNLSGARATEAKGDN